jgi:2-iminobutanoate/2-iminopropanoate deaminase
VTVLLENAERKIMKKVVETDKYPRARGPYSQAVVADQFIFLSGVGPQDPKTNIKTSGGITEQTKQVLSNIRGLLEDVGGSMEDVVKVSVFLNDINDFAPMNKVYETFFAHDPPARMCAQAARLLGDDLVAMDAIAFLPKPVLFSKT